MPTDRFATAIAAFDSYHQKDPNTESVDGRPVPKELLYARRMTERLASFAPQADESVKLAARCQHIGRWEIPREQYPMDRKGYLQWRNQEKIHHARIAEKVLEDCGYEPTTIEKVKLLILKKELFTNSDTQLLEDVACLVFLEHYAEKFAAKHTDEKVVDILRKTLKKMSGEAKRTARELPLANKLRLLLDQATKSD